MPHNAGNDEACNEPSQISVEPEAPDESPSRRFNQAENRDRIVRTQMHDTQCNKNGEHRKPDGTVSIAQPEPDGQERNWNHGTSLDRSRELCIAPIRRAECDEQP